MSAIIYDTYKIGAIIVEEAVRHFPLSKNVHNEGSGVFSEKTKNYFNNNECEGVRIFKVISISKYTKYVNKVGTIVHYKAGEFIYIIDDEKYRAQITSIAQKVSKRTDIIFVEKKRAELNRSKDICSLLGL